MKWFVLENEEIKGPYDKNQVKNDFQGENVLVWSPGLDEWTSHLELAKENFSTTTKAKPAPQNLMKVQKTEPVTQNQKPNQPVHVTTNKIEKVGAAKTPNEKTVVENININQQPFEGQTDVKNYFENLATSNEPTVVDQSIEDKTRIESNLNHGANDESEKTTIEQPFEDPNVLESFLNDNDIAASTEKTRIESSISSNEKTTIEENLNEATVVQIENQPEQVMWYYAYEGKRSNALNYEDLLSTIALLSKINKVHIWNKNLDNWAKLKDFPEIYNQVIHLQNKAA